MSNPGGKRRSLLADAIESIGTQPVTTTDAGHAPATTPDKVNEDVNATSFLERRGIAFDEIARTVKRLTIRVKPSECSIWPGNARDYAALTNERCATLIDSIREEGTNREPVVVRRTPNADRPYELIVGTRRHFSVSWLHANNHTEIDLVARIESLDDEGAFRLADIENREREDVTDLERARNYRFAVDAYYNGVRTQMAERLAIPKQNLHNQLQLAELPDEVIAAFAEPGDIKVRHGMRLAPMIKDERYREVVLATAKVLAAEQQALGKSGAGKIEGSKVFERLVAAGLVARPKPAAKAHASISSSSGREIGQVLSDSKAKGITIKVHPKGHASIDEILDALRITLERAKFARG
jgi:ParB family chromosome partitioning protein